MIEFRVATKYYKDNIGIEKINLEVKPGEVVGIIGKNGSGKTTLLRAAANLIDLNQGWVLVDGNLVSDKVYEKLSYISEEGSFFPNLTPQEHEEFFRRMYKSFDSERFNKLLKHFELPRNKKLRSFSRGQKSKFEVICGFCKGAKYILMDEPFLGTDIATRSDFLRLMIGSMKEDDIIIIGTNFIEEIENFLSRAVLLEGGYVKDIIDIEELSESGVSFTDMVKKVLKYNEGGILDILDGR